MLMGKDILTYAPAASVCTLLRHIRVCVNRGDKVYHKDREMLRSFLVEKRVLEKICVTNDGTKDI